MHVYSYTITSKNSHYLNFYIFFECFIVIFWWDFCSLYALFLTLINLAHVVLQYAEASLDVIWYESHIYFKLFFYFIGNTFSDTYDNTRDVADRNTGHTYMHFGFWKIDIASSSEHLWLMSHWGCPPVGKIWCFYGRFAL